MEPLGLKVEALATSLGVASACVRDVIAGRKPIDANMDLRLARYFGMSEGFFLGLQIDYDLLEAKRAVGGEINRILPRAA